MKKSLFIVGLAAACAFALTACVKETQPCTTETEFSESTPFELEVSFPATKTSIDEEFKVAWEEGDQINVFHTVAGSKNFINDGAFTVKEAGLKGSFAGEIKGVLYPEKEYDWYIVYPYSADATSPAECPISVKNPDRTLSDGTNLLAGLPLYGKVAALSGATTPTMKVHQVMSAIKMTFKNTSDEAISPRCIRFKSVKSGYKDTEDTMIQPVGDFIVDFTAASPVFAAKEGGFCPKHSTGNLPGTDNIQPGESFSTYLYIIPSTFNAGTVLEFGANNGAPAKYEQLENDLVFKAGEIQEFNINLGVSWISAEEAAEGILFRFCMKNSNDDNTFGDNVNANAYGGLWAQPGQTSPTVGQSRRNAARFFSVKDHFSHYSDASEYFYGSAWISTGRWQDAPECANSGGRYFLPGLKFDPANGEDYYLINAKLAELKAGTKAVFKTSFMVNEDATPKNWIISYSVDGGKSFLPAEVAAPSSIDETHGDVVVFGYVNDRACHPVTITCPITANAENVDFQIKIKPVAATYTTKGMFSFAPYYELASADAPLRVYTAKNLGKYGITPVYEYVTTMEGKFNKGTVEAGDAQYSITNPGDVNDLSACATLVIK